MASDISRTSDEQRYQGVVMQQGRVILDRDFNALRQTIDRRIEADALDFVGPCGTPDNGFEIGPVAASPPLWIPPAPLSPPASNADDFSISPGTMYVGGQRAVFPSEVPGQVAVDYSYFDQPDWISPDLPSAFPTCEFIYLHLLEHEVSAVEDPELKDVALGGPDTTQRLRLVKRVKRLAVPSCECAAARAQAVSQWQQKGLAFDPQTMRLIPQATMQVSYSQPTTQTSPCDPVAQGGYLGADNQLIRVQITDGGVPGATPQLLWGCDNASSLYRAKVSNQLSTQTSTAIVLGQSPVDAFHIPQQGQVVEVLRCALIIGSELDETDPQQPATIVRCVAEARGITCTLTAPYQPDTRTLSLNQVLPPEYLNDANPLFVRIWQTQIPFTPDGSTPYPLTYANGNSTGVLVTIGVPSTASPQLQSPPIGAYWMIAVRPKTPQAVYPERFLVSPQPPDGPRQWVCPLGTIDWTNQTSPPSSPVYSNPVFYNCRNIFCNLIELCNRKLGGCCNVAVRPEDLVADPMALQNAADQFRDAAQGMAICLTPGTYALSQPLHLNSRHTGLTIEACHGAVTIQAAATADFSPFLHGLVVLAATDSITLKGITFVPPPVDLTSAMPVPSGGVPNNLQAALVDLSDPQMRIGLRLLDCTDLKVIGCGFQLGSAIGVANFGAGIYANGNCTGLSVRQSTFTGPGHAITEIVVLAKTEQNVAPPAAGGVATKRTKAKKATLTPAAAFAATGASSPISQIVLAQRISLLNAPQRIAAAAGAQIPDVPTAPVEFSTPPPIMLAAFLMAPSIDPTFNWTNPLTLIGGSGGKEARLLAQAVLDQAEFVDNRMQGLSVAMLGTAVAGTVTIRDNFITDCIGGIWFASQSDDKVLDAGIFQASLGISVQQGFNAAIAMAIAMWYPPPQTFSPIANLQALPPQFQVVNNRIDALPLDGSFSGPACMLAIAPPPVDTTDMNNSVLLNSNQIRNSSDPNIPPESLTWLFGATVFLFDASNTIVGANLIRNMAILDGANIFSLIVFPGAGGTTAVSGNLLAGNSIVAP
jgi:hypothetical protein